MRKIVYRNWLALGRKLRGSGLIFSVIREILGLFRIGSWSFRFQIYALSRMEYAFLVYQAAKQANLLGFRNVSVLEFGCAGGNGLLILEEYATAVEKIFPVEIEIYGFDSGKGLPEPRDYRDLPYFWKSGFFEMDRDKLKNKLRRSTIVIGDVAETVSTFFDDYNPGPIGGISHDLDYYSSTAASFSLFECSTKYFLPRFVNYFDDIIGTDIENYNDYTGERLAINEFNSNHPKIKFAPAEYLRTSPYSYTWHHQILITHMFDHPKYNSFVGKENQQLPLD